MQEINMDCKRKRLKFRRFQFSDEETVISHDWTPLLSKIPHGRFLAVSWNAYGNE